MKTIYVVGGFGRNFGDLALQHGMWRELRQMSEEALDFVPIDCQSTFIHPALVDEINETADLLIVGGGGFVFHRPEDNSRSGWQFNIQKEDLARLRVPLVIYGIGYNKFYYDDRGFNPQMNDHLRATQKQAALFSVRNHGTATELVSRSLDPRRIEVIPDPGMFVRARAIELPRLGDGVYKLGLNWAGDRNYYRFPEPWQEVRAAVIRNLCAAITALFERLGGGKVVFIPHLADIDSEVAPLFAEYLGDTFYNIERELPQLYPPAMAQSPFLAGIYAQMDLVIGMRGHANIIPFGMNTPTIALGTHDKNRFFMAEIGEPDNVIDGVRDPETCSQESMLAVIDRVINDNKLKPRMARRLAEHRVELNRFNARVLALLH